jgi:hypothetical protein
MADEVDDFDFDDDALDELPENTLNELEHNAFLSTQHASPPVARLQTRGNGRSLWPGNQFLPETRPPARPVSRPPSDYGLDDEDVINLEEQPLSVQQAYEEWSQSQRIVQRVPEVSVQARIEGGSEQPQVDMLKLQQQVLQVRCLLSFCYYSIL